MGTGYLITCKKCGMSKQLLLGMGAIHPNHFRPDILEGKFGEDVKEYLEQNPDAFFLVYHIPYGCGCGYVTEFPEVEFPDRDVHIRRKPHRCSNCGKRMRRNNWGSGKCWKCGGDLDSMENVMWDRNVLHRYRVRADEQGVHRGLQEGRGSGWYRLRQMDGGGRRLREGDASIPQGRELLDRGIVYLRPSKGLGAPLASRPVRDIPGIEGRVRPHDREKRLQIPWEERPDLGYLRSPSRGIVRPDILASATNLV